MRILKFYLPGIIFATTGLVIFSTLQTKTNYYLLHSIWHICMAISIVFFLPDKKSAINKLGSNKKKVQTKTLASISSQTTNGSSNGKNFKK